MNWWYAREIAKSSTNKIEEALKYCRKLFSHFIPRIVLKDGGLPDIEFEVGWSKRSETSIGEEILETPQRIARSKKRKVVVVFDEFTQIDSYNRRSFEGFIRSFIQHHHNVCYIFTASKTRLLLEMTGSPKRPFYHSGRLMRLDRIPKDEFKSFAKKGFNSTGVRISDILLEQIFAITQNHPYYNQMFCHELWNLVQVRKSVATADLEVVLNNIIHHQSDYFLARWEELSEHQRTLLFAVTSSGGENVFSADFIRRNNLGSASSIQRSLKRLIELQILEKVDNRFEITDVFFALWLRRKIM